MGFQEEVSAALASLDASRGGAEAVSGADGDAVVDAIADPGGAARGLLGDRVVLRAAPSLGAAATGYGPTPAAPVWLRLSRSARAVALAPLRGGERLELVASRVEVEETLERCCDAASCTLKKQRTAVWLHLEGGGAPPRRLLIAEQRTLEAAPAPAVHVVAHRLASLLGLPAEPGPPPDAGEALPEALGSIRPVELARFALRSEGERIVLRDHASVGPRASAPRNTVIGALLMVIAGLFGAQLAAALRAGSTAAAVVFGVGVALFTLAGVAFIGVARYSARYRAESSPVLAFGLGRFIVLPWVSRSGAVDLRLEGRLGAAIPLGELRGVSVQRRGPKVTVEIDSDHGPIDTLVTEDEAAAHYWSSALSRIAAEARHPGAGASARQRARAKGREEVGGPPRGQI